MTWDAPSPTYDGTHLPGGGMTLDVLPQPRWVVLPRNVRALHGCLTVTLAQPHHERWPLFALVPHESRFGWGVYVHDERVAAGLALKELPVRLFGSGVTMKFSTLWRHRVPRVDPGRCRVRVDFVTPLCVRCTGGRIWRAEIDQIALASVLSGELAPRLRVGHLSRSTIRAEIVSSDMRTVRVPLGGKFGDATGSVGTMIVDANAPARWLLESAAVTTGLGSRTAFGFGRFKVSNLEV